MKYLRTPFLLMTLMFLGISCTPIRIQPQCEEDFLFSIPVSITPALDTFQVGDTIHIEMDFPVVMQEENSGMLYDMTDFPFNTEVNISWINTTLATGADRDVEYIIRKGELDVRPLTEAESAILLGFLQEEDRFRLELDVVVNKAGLLIMGFDGNTRQYFSYDLDKTCRNEFFLFSFPWKDNVESNNFGSLTHSRSEYHRNLDKETFDSFGGYVFWVEE